MKRTVKVLLHSKHAKIVDSPKGDCYDLIACEEVKLTSGKVSLISLGLSMKLPSGCYARVYDRSSTPLKRGFKIANSVGIIDNSYSSDKDIWRYTTHPVSSKKQDIVIKEGDRICQFEICLSQKATVWQKLKWLFTSGYKFEYVETLKGNVRGGFGSSDK